MSSTTVHRVAATGFGEGTNELYDRARPSYQPQVLQYIRDQISSPGSLHLVELGSGTGIFTRALLAHPAWTSALGALRAFEPSSGMRDQFNKTVHDPRVSCHDGTFDTTSVEDGWADAVIIAQAFHWCPDFNAASAEFARILKPGGAVFFVWNLEDREKARWVAQLRDTYEQHENGAPQFRLGLWRAAFDTPNYVQSFEKPIEQTWSYAITSTEDSVVDRVCSKSYIAILPDDEKNKVKAAASEIVRKGDEKVWIDENAGVFEYPYQTLVVLARKK
ncbi:S-adenosyl-L-methionine-dependent methyltransferase [Punctularia strigosozonata HHB-11173 SS5]|uniref:S-adenosyl-L-methionine-dependent methyltransferase n=1 Tax=Punctularia strigosozonata (strain HHB-11173) TaxID=741275 RepID=UPI000441661F|nr:S-adenosyl-L-methionine-dependent methyltransferase [Punctularia strigosozonata HHB-11173 SS5]EIN07332.1 S-adenosyl-L-methionine-dependent methyltransferase [Punctularia strigosozonata HHB-11173 SS5]